MNRRRCSWSAAFLAVSLALPGSGARPARALVGPAEAGHAFASHVVMVLARSGARSGFCSGVVLAPDVVLTAAHCVASAAATRVHYRAQGGQPVLLDVAEVATHPLYRANAAQTRERSIDLAIVRTATSLPATFSPVSLSASAAIAIGDRFKIAGFGLAQEDRPATGGTLRAGTLAARAPLSQILLWADDPAQHGLGACTGDSGAPVFDASASNLVAIVDWAEGTRGHACGQLTQAALVAPQRAWIDGVLRRFAQPRR